MRAISTRWLSLFRTVKRLLLSATNLLGVSAYDCLLLQNGVFIEEGIFVEKCFFKRLRRLAMLKIGFSFVCRVSCSKCSRA
ncbi:hypothetical protein YC2023_050141 [Brassica napus]